MKTGYGAAFVEPMNYLASRRKTIKTIAASLCILGMPFGAAAQAQQSYPNRLITIIVPFSPGTGADILGRTLGQRLGQKLNVPVVVENKAGASGNIGAEFVARAAPDGYTLVVTATSFVTNAAVNKNVRYDPIKSFVPVSLLATASMGLVVSKDFPAKSVKELVAVAKAKPGTINYASTGVGTPQHLAMEQFKLATGVDIVHVPFKAAAGAVNDVAGGHIDTMILPVHTAAPFLQSGKMRLLAVMGEERSVVHKEVPTLAEEGYKNLEADVWYGVLAPAGTPTPIVARLNKELDTLLANPEIREVLSNQGMVSAGGPPERFTNLIKSEQERWPRVVAQAGITGE
jgi:tripartite-type tricarboxylate transporter receptor subunit TctC